MRAIAGEFSAIVRKRPAVLSNPPPERKGPLRAIEDDQRGPHGSLPGANAASCAARQSCVASVKAGRAKSHAITELIMASSPIHVCVGQRRAATVRDDSMGRDLFVLGTGTDRALCEITVRPVLATTA